MQQSLTLGTRTMSSSTGCDTSSRLGRVFSLVAAAAPPLAAPPALLKEPKELEPEGALVEVEVEEAVLPLAVCDAVVMEVLEVPVEELLEPEVPLLVPTLLAHSPPAQWGDQPAWNNQGQKDESCVVLPFWALPMKYCTCRTQHAWAAKIK